MVRSMKGKDDILKAQVYIIHAYVAFLCGKKTLEQWVSKLDKRNGSLEIGL